MKFLRHVPFRGRYLVEGEAAVYHVVSRTAFARFAFSDTDKAQFLRILQKQAGFCGLQVLAYCLLDNHFHLLVEVPEALPVDDNELLRRYRLLYGGPHCPPSSPTPEVLASLLRANEEAGRQWRERILARMHDLPVFMRELKQRFGIWYNRRHKNRGTLWAERFRSTIVERSHEALSTVAAYIDLNPVRAGLVDDPADFHFSSFGRASGGNHSARKGYQSIFGQGQRWAELLPHYCLVLYGKGERSKGVESKDFGRIDPIKADRILRSGGRISRAEALRRRVRYFSAGTAVGSKGFIENLGCLWNIHGKEAKRQKSHSLQGADWGSLKCYRHLKYGVALSTGGDRR